jgi:2-haloalkanoic acid dehalogenase type II
MIGQSTSATRRYDAVVFDLLTALLDSWKLWNTVAGSAEDGLGWRRAYLRLTYDCGAYRPYEELVREAAESCGLRSGLAAALVSRFAELEPWEDAAEVLAALAGNGLALGVATNCSAALAAVASSRVGAVFTAVVSAEEAGFYKPRPEPYLRVLEKLDVAPQRALFVAGSPADIPGAGNVGMPVSWHNRIGLPALDGRSSPLMTARSLRPLLDLV